MDSSRQRAAGNAHSDAQPAGLPLRFRRQPAQPVSGAVFPFTEMPKELRGRPVSIGGWIRKIAAGFLLLFLILALLILVLAFAYQLIHNPQVLAGWCSDLICTAQAFIASLISAFQ